MEYMDKGSLSNLIEKHIHFDECIIAYICKSVLNALQFIHSKNHIHRGIICLLVYHEMLKVIIFLLIIKEKSNLLTLA